MIFVFKELISSQRDVCATKWTLELLDVQRVLWCFIWAKSSQLVPDLPRMGWLKSQRNPVVGKIAVSVDSCVCSPN